MCIKSVPDIQWSSLGKLLDNHNTYEEYSKYSKFSKVYLSLQRLSYFNKPPYEKANIVCATRNGSDKPEHPPSLISLHCPHEESFGLDIQPTPLIIEPRREKTGFLHMRKQRRRSASR